MIKQIKFVSVPVADQNRALDFYTEKLGFTIITDQPFDEKQRWIELRIPKAETRVVLFTAALLMVTLPVLAVKETDRLPPMVELPLTVRLPVLLTASVMLVVMLFALLSVTLPAPVRFTAIRRFQFSSEISGKGQKLSMAALLMRIVIGPSAPRTLATAALTSAPPSAAAARKPCSRAASPAAPRSAAAAY